MLSVNNVTMRFGPRVLFENVTCTFMAGRRYAITGPNGAGKSTFMKILTGELDSTSGSVTRPKKMGVLRQDQFAFDEYRVIDTVIMGNAALWKALEERDALYAKPHEQLTDTDGMRLGEIEGIVGEEGGYTAEADAAVLLDGLGVEGELHERKMGELQGGQKVRVLLAQALFGNPTALLLDETANKEFRKLVTTELTRINIQRPKIKFDMKKKSGKNPMEIRSVEKSYDDLKVIPRFSASVVRGEKIALMGRNGAGKTTMLKSLVRNAPGFIEDKDQQFPIDGGEVRWGHEVAVGYFAQDHGESITKGMTAIDWLWQFDPTASQQELRGLMGQMLFSGEDALKPTRALSGGESARLIFCRLMLQKPNFLVLDEPTNHLDLESINALNIALQRYDGTVLLVTHDHDVIDEVATRIWHFHGGKIEDFKGTYEEFVAYEEVKAAQGPIVPARAGSRRASVPS